MPITPELLRGLSTLDDLIGFVAALGYAPLGHELNEDARERLGLAGACGVRRAAVVGRHGALRVFGVQVERASRGDVASVVERLARSAPGEPQVVLALDPSGTLAVAALAPGADGRPCRQLRVAAAEPSAATVEILSGLAPKPGETALGLSVRIADVLAEEGLTRRFFKELARLHDSAAAAARDMPRATAADRREFALVVITRILFLYFVQSKGWLAGRRDFLPSALDTALGRGHPFHRTVFEPLCFGALSTPARSRSASARALGPVPFLNGGLFERHGIERRFPRAHLDNETWRDLFDELFERFHFTVRERDDRDAVDPEMLGRVFEGLMAADRRKASGTYFTPPELLRSTVGAALDAALQGAGADRLASIRILDPAVGSGAFLLECLVQLEQRRARLAPRESATERRRAILRDNLFGVDVDPLAVRLAELRLWLALVAGDDATIESVAPLPNLDQNLRQGDSLLSPLDLARTASATVHSPRLTRVAERRALYFAAAGREKAALARAIRADERAIAIEATDAAILVLTSRLKDAAAAIGPDLFGRRATRTPAQTARVRQWRRHRNELAAVRRRIASDETLPFFSFDVHFGTVLAAGGFDVVIGNPPWVRGERLPATVRTALARQYESFRAATARHTAPRGFAHLPDLSVAFVERALQLARPSGIVAMTLPAKLLRAGYAGPLRALVRRDATLLALDDRAHAVGHEFDATVFPSVWVLKNQAAADVPVRVRTVAASGREIAGHATTADLSIDPAIPGAPWLALPRDTMDALRQAFGAGPALSSTFRPLLGVKTGANEIFVRHAGARDELPQSCRAPALLGRDVRPFRAEPSCMMLAAMESDGRPLDRVPADVADYLRPHASRLARRSDARSEPPWAVFRTDLLRGRWIVVWRDIAETLEAAVIDRARAPAPIPLNTCYGVIAPDRFTARWLAALLNSGPLRVLACATADRASGGCFRFLASIVGPLPLPAVPSSPDVRALSEITEPRHDLDAIAARALGLEPGVQAALARLGDALRRNADRDR